LKIKNNLEYISVMAQQLVTIKEYNMNQLTLIDIRRIISAVRKAMGCKYRLCLMPVGPDPDFFEGMQILQGPLMPSKLRENKGMEPVQMTLLRRQVTEDEANHKMIACPYHRLIRDLIQEQRLRFLRAYNRNIPTTREDEDAEEVPALVRYAKNSLSYHWSRGRKWKGDCNLEIDETDFRVKDPRLYAMLAEALACVPSKQMPPAEIDQCRTLMAEWIKMTSS
jgi:hypothetical protein